MPQGTSHPGTWDLWGKGEVGVLGGENSTGFGVHLLVLGSPKQERWVEAPQPSSMPPLGTSLGAAAIFGTDECQRDTAKDTGPGWEGGGTPSQRRERGAPGWDTATTATPGTARAPHSSPIPPDLPSPSVPSPTQFPPFPCNP